MGERHCDTMSGFPDRLVRLLVAAVAGLSLTLPSLCRAQEQDCTRAKERYEQGTRLLNFHERRAAFQDAVDLCPAYADAHTNLADACENLGDFDAAERHYRKAMELDPGSATPYIGLGEVSLKTGRYAMALDAFAGGLAVSPDSERSADGFAVASERLKRTRDFRDADQILDCLLKDERFRLMCMCPGDHYSFLRKWICVPAIHFASGSAALTPEARRQLNEIGRAFTSGELAGKKWLVIGHADIVGTDGRNRKYSAKRARAVQRYLVANWGLAEKSLSVHFFGHDRPVAANNTVGGREQNRRVEIVLDE